MKVAHLVTFAFCSIASCIHRGVAQDQVPVPRSLVQRVLIEACASGDIETVLVLVPRCHTLDFRTRVKVASGTAKWTPLTAAIAHKQWEIAAHLIGAGASVSFARGDGYEPLWFLAYHADHDPHALRIAEMMLVLKADPLHFSKAPSDSFCWETAVHRAAIEGEVELIRMFIQHGVNFDVPTGDQPSVRDFVLVSFDRFGKESPPSNLSQQELAEWTRKNEIYILFAYTPNPSERHEPGSKPKRSGIEDKSPKNDRVPEKKKRNR